MNPRFTWDPRASPELAEVRGDTAGIRAKVHRNAVKRDVVVLIDQLG